MSYPPSATFPMAASNRPVNNGTLTPVVVSGMATMRTFRPGRNTRNHGSGTPDSGTKIPVVLSTVTVAVPVSIRSPHR